MKIIYLSNMNIAKKGGATTHFFELGGNLIKLGVNILTIVPGYLPRTKNDGNLNVIYLPTFKGHVLSYLWAEFMKIFYLVYYIKKFKPDVIYARQELLDFMPPLIARLFQMPYVIEINGLAEDELVSMGMKRIVPGIFAAVRRINGKCAQNIICVSEGIKKEIIRRDRQDENKIVVIPNGANTDIFHPLSKLECRKRFGLSEAVFYVGFVGSFLPWQGLDILVESARIINQSGSEDIKFILIGDGMEKEKLTKKVQECGLQDTVLFYARVDYENIVYYINAFDLAVAPYTSKNESLALGSPLKLFEYLACGKPIIATQMDGISNILNELNYDCFFKKNDAFDLAGKIIKMYKNSNELEQMGRTGRALALEKYNWNKTAFATKQIIKRLFLRQKVHEANICKIDNKGV